MEWTAGKIGRVVSLWSAISVFKFTCWLGDEHYISVILRVILVAGMCFEDRAVCSTCTDSTFWSRPREVLSREESIGDTGFVPVERSCSIAPVPSCRGLDTVAGFLLFCLCFLIIRATELRFSLGQDLQILHSRVSEKDRYRDISLRHRLHSLYESSVMPKQRSQHDVEKISLT